MKPTNEEILRAGENCTPKSICKKCCLSRLTGVAMQDCCRYIANAGRAIAKELEKGEKS